MTAEKSPRKRMAYGLPADPHEVVHTASEVQKVMAVGINPDGSLRPEAIRALLKMKGVNLRAFAETHGFSDAYLHQVINREHESVVVEDFIARAIGMDPERVWARRPFDAVS